MTETDAGANRHSLAPAGIRGKRRERSKLAIKNAVNKQCEITENVITTCGDLGKIHIKEDY